MLTALFSGVPSVEVQKDIVSLPEVECRALLSTLWSVHDEIGTICEERAVEIRAVLAANRPFYASGAMTSPRSEAIDLTTLFAGESAGEKQADQSRSPEESAR